ncbi:Nop domain-containing protein [Fragilariopsis cylindrus CCMP1102]|uniref:Nop domain-containing protein n=1 Tax=Fragilariopsis cylindrus CCMP1102 TaxID=635003 RepID=A0A1E7FBE6_9STRA|nr:Nop domain-containing protein [Fragilariopsis cylindrus CCMP1102]|eukprot:OEU15469.1 Nop domain-containing protein [Fragilariopsis cylindrus CCMP1102]
MEATTTLADALLDDLDDLNDSSDDEQQNETTETHDNNNEHHQNEDDRILNQPKVGSATAAVSRFIDTSSSTSTATRQKEREEENHQLVVKSNKYLASLGEEMGRAHGELAKTYKAKFPELEELLPNHINYKNAVRAIGNETDLTRVNDKLSEILSSNQIITISVAGSTTSGRQLTDAELQAVDTAANYMEELLVVQQQLMKFVENSMESLCPSICALVGSSIAARLLGLAGGLQELTKIPACNLQVLGQTKVNSESRAGMSGIAIKQHTGLLAECQLVQSVPSSHRKKALKVVAAKLALVGRYDFSNVDSGRKRSASIGLDYRNQLEEKFIKLLEPDKAPTRKALPKPDLEAKKRRGGRRMRRMKERFEETAMMKQANTRAFSTQQGEYGDDSMGITMGLLDTTDSGGAIRKVTEKRKMKQADTKKTRKRAMQMAQQAKNNDGLASMELINPDANKQKVKAANEQWFKNNAGFQSALPKRGT